MANIARYWQKILSISLGFIILLLITAVFWLGNSLSGLHWVIKQAEAFAPGTLKIARVEGQLFKQITLHDFSFEQSNTLLVQAEKLNLSWQIGSLLERTAYINQIQLEGVKLDLMASTEPSQDKNQQGHIDIEKLPHIQLPLKIIISELLLKDLQLSLKQPKASIQSYTVEHLNITDIVVENDFKIGSAALSIPAQEKIPQLGLKWSLLSSLAPPFKSQIALSWQADFPRGNLPLEHFPEGLAAQGSMDISGDIHQLTIKKNIIKPLQLGVLANINQPLKKLNWDGKITWQELHWPLNTVADIPKQLLLQKGQLDAKGGLEKYELNLNTQIGGQRIPDGNWKIIGKGDNKQFSIIDLHAQILDGEINSQGDIAWQPQLRAALETSIKGLHLNQLRPDIPINTPLDSFLRLELQDETLIVDELVVHLPQTGAKIQIDGEVEQLKTDPEANLVINWQDLKWPLMDEPIIAKSSVGKVKLVGGLKHYVVNLNSQLSGKDIPQGNWEAVLTGDQNQLDSFNINGKLLNGETQINGSAGWQNFPRWNVSVNAKNIQPQIQWPQLPGLLSVNLQTQGQFKEEGLMAHVAIDQLKGKIKGYPIRLSADLNSDGVRHKLNHLDFYSGKNHISGKADVVSDKKPENMHINASYRINAPQIGSFLPEARGQIKGNGTVHGNILQPRIEADLSAKKVSFNEWQLEKFNSNISFNPEQDGKLNLKLVVQQLLQNNQEKVESLKLTAKGKLKKHKINLFTKTAKESVKMELNGGLDLNSKVWNGHLEKLNLAANLLGQWRLTSPSRLSLSQQQVKLNPACLKAKQHVGQICTDLDWLKGQAGIANLQVKQLSISQIADPFLPSHIGLSGMILNGSINSQIRETELGTRPIDADLNLTITPGRVFTLLEGRQYLLPFKGADLNLAVDDNGLRGNLGAKIFNNSTIQGNVALAEFNQLPIAQTQPLDIKFATNFVDLDILPSLSPLLKNTAGQLNLDINVDGDINNPNINGQMLLKAKADIPPLGLELKEISGKIVTDDSYQRLNLNGNILSGEGFNRFSGKLDLSDIANWQAQLKVYGEQFRTIHNNDFKVWLAPDLQLQAQPGELEIDGKLHIPKAILTPQVNLEAGGGKVSSSSDVVVVDEPQEDATEAPSSWKIKGKLDVLVGDDIKIDVADFKSGMEGKVSMVFGPDNIIPKGQGELNIVNGTYKAYGQDLEISQGRIFFQGTPMDNPGLGIRAIRRIKNNSFNAVDVAGIDIRGTAKAPRLSLFSEPKVSDADIISYIVTGSAITGGDIESRELTLGKYISPSFYVSLGYDLFEGNKSFNLRYDINKKWGIEGLAGDRDSGVDLSFSLGR